MEHVFPMNNVKGPTFMLYKTLNELLHPETLPTERHGSESNPQPEPRDDRHAGRERKPAVSSGWKTQSRHEPEEHGGPERKPKRPRTRYSMTLPLCFKTHLMSLDKSHYIT